MVQKIYKSIRVLKVLTKLLKESNNIFTLLYVHLLYLHSHKGLMYLKATKTR